MTSSLQTASSWISTKSPTPKTPKLMNSRDPSRVFTTKSGGSSMHGSIAADTLGYINFGLPFQEHHIQTGCGIMSIIVYDDPDKLALITYPDLALNYISCFQGLFYVQKQLLYCFTTFAYIISVLLDMRFLNLNGSGAGVSTPSSTFFGSSLKKVIASRVPNTKIPYEYISTGLRQ
ncbi:hypothetical protein JHK82_050612 [Glycine max]|nr:hypothetical protein JHK86_050463 [Glycine max]KAG4936405.1 hypothetical protein JHK85_051324 [Glycine max]KAG5091834.1 hypothetical protein JHK82_050612 [Glycine max]